MENNFEKMKALSRETGRPILIASQKKCELNFTPTQLNTLESVGQMKASDIILSIKRSNSGSFKMFITQTVYSPFRSLFRK